MNQTQPIPGNQRSSRNANPSQQTSLVQNNWLAQTFEQNLLKLSSSNKLINRYISASDSSKLSYQQFYVAVNKCASFIENCFENTNKLCPEQKWVIVALNESITRLAVLMACIKLQIFYIPCDPQLSRLNIPDFQLPGLGICIREDAEIRVTPRIPIHMNILKSELDKQIENLEDDVKFDPSNLPAISDPIVFLLFTSGSTGIPKQVFIRVSHLRNRLNWQWTRIPFRAPDTDVLLNKTSLLFIDGNTEYLSALLQCVSIHIINPVKVCDFVVLAKVLRHHRITWMTVVPTVLEQWIDVCKHLSIKSQHTQTHREPFQHPTIHQLNGCLDTMICSGSILTRRLAEDFFNYFRHFSGFDSLRLINLYGSTEVCGDITWAEFSSMHEVRDPTNSKNGMMTVGVAIDDCKVELQSVENEEDFGIVKVSGASVTGDDHQFVMGDLGIIEHDKLFIMGRKTNDFVKINEKRINPLQIDDTMKSHPMINEVKTLLTARNKLTCFYTFKENQSSDEQQQTQSLQDFWSKHRNLDVTLAFQLMPGEHLSRLSSQKIDIQALLKMTNANRTVGNTQPDNANSDCRPLNCQNIQNAILSVLNVSNTNEHDILKRTFFELGGDSLKMIECIDELRKKCRVNVEHEIFQECSIIQIAAKVTQDYHNAVAGHTNFQSVNHAEQFEILQNEMDAQYETSVITEHDDILEFLAKEFMHADRLSQLIGFTQTELENIAFKKIVPPFIKEGLSRKMLDINTRQLVAVIINYRMPDKLLDYNKPTTLPVTDKMEAVENFLRYCEAPLCKLDLPKSRMCFLMLGVSQTINAKNRVRILTYLEYKTLQIAKSNGFECVYALNTHPATQKVASTLGYELITKHSLKDFYKTIEFPLTNANEDLTAMVTVKRIKNDANI